jgi:hypothetical protein
MSDSYLTAQDVQNYGTELLDVSQRAALHALAPVVQDLERQHEDLQRRLAKEARRNLDAAVERAIPNYREIDRDPRWHQFLRETDLYTGQPRQALLNIAIADGSATRVVALFRGFLQEVGGSQQAGAQTSRSAPARASSGGPIYSREQITKLYDQHRRGAYAGREAEWAKLEVDIIRAGREGRIQNPVSVAGK